MSSTRPTSDKTNYLNTGMHFGVGLDFLVAPFLSLGVDLRYTVSFNEASTKTSVLSSAGYVGLNF